MKRDQLLTTRERKETMRILISTEARHRIYREAIAKTMRTLRPILEVAVCESEKLERELGSLEPHVVVYDDQDNGRAELPGGPLAWIELSLQPERPSRAYVGGRSTEMLNPSIEDLVEIADEAQALYGLMPGAA